MGAEQQRREAERKAVQDTENAKWEGDVAEAQRKTEDEVEDEAEAEEVRGEAERKVAEEAENARREAEAAEAQRKSGEEKDEERREAKREAEEEAKNTKRVAEAADDAQIDAKEEPEPANSEAERMKSHSTEGKDAVPQTPAVQLCEGGAPKLESGGTDGSLNLDLAFKEPLLQIEPIEPLTKAEGEDLDLECQEFMQGFQFETEDDVKSLPVCNSDDEKKRWSTYVNYEHDKEKQVADTEEENEEEEEEVMEKEAVEIEVEETEEVLKGNKEENNGSGEEDQDFAKGFQFDTEDEKRGIAGADEAGKTNSSLSNSDIGEEETEEYVEERGQEYNKLERLEDALAQNYRPLITSGSRDASTSKIEFEAGGDKNESQNEEAIDEEVGEKNDIKEQGEVKEGGDIEEEGENEEEGEIKKKGEIKKEGEIKKKGEIKKEGEIKKNGEIKEEGKIKKNGEIKEDDEVNESELEEV